MRIFPITALLVSSLLPFAAFASDDSAVMQHCGKPQSQEVTTNQDTNRLQRNLVYGDHTLNFVPDGSAWRLTTAWNRGLPESRPRLEASMPCLRDAMDDTVALRLPDADPIVAGQVPGSPTVNRRILGIAHLPTILLLVLIAAVLMVLPRSRDLTESELRLPNLARRRPHVRVHRIPATT